MTKINFPKHKIYICMKKKKKNLIRMLPKCYAILLGEGCE